MGSQRVWHDWATEQQMVEFSQICVIHPAFSSLPLRFLSIHVTPSTNCQKRHQHMPCRSIRLFWAVSWVFSCPNKTLTPFFPSISNQESHLTKILYQKVHAWKTLLFSLIYKILYSPWNFPGQNTGIGGHSLLHGIFPTQGLNPGLPHCILYHLSHQGSPWKIF